MTLSVSWILTVIFARHMLWDNPLKARSGYNSPCVGFDDSPASWVATPMLVCIAYLSARFAWTDAQRLTLVRATGGLTNTQYQLLFAADAWYAFAMVLLCAFPLR
jgi:hypothetical protein